MAVAVVLASLRVKYEHKETRELLGWFEYQTARNVCHFVPIYDEVDRAHAKKFWQKDWDGLPEDWSD